MIAKLLLVVFYLLAPAGVLWATRKFDLLRRLGPVLTLYILGVIVANIGIFPSDPDAHKSFLDFQESVSEILVPLALPMMLFGCNFKRFSVGKSLSAFIVGVVSVAAIVVVSYLMFAEGLGTEEAPKMAAALAGQYTGGAANLAAVKQMVGLSTENFVMLSTCNLIVSFFYLMFLMGGGVALARKIVGRNNHIDQEVEVDQNDDNPYRDFAKRLSVIQLLKVFAASVVIMGVSVAVGTVAGGESGISMVALILTITTLSLLMTASKQVRSWDKSYDAGMYLIYVFCLVMATMADLSSINWEQSLFVLMFQAVIIFGSLFVTIFAARPLRIDADTAVITSNTLINSPVCVPMIAATMKNRDVVVVGITNGLAGYAVGNYLGYLIYQLLQTL